MVDGHFRAWNGLHTAAAPPPRRDLLRTKQWWWCKNTLKLTFRCPARPQIPQRIRIAQRSVKIRIIISTGGMTESKSKYVKNWGNHVCLTHFDLLSGPPEPIYELPSFFGDWVSGWAGCHFSASQFWPVFARIVRMVWNWDRQIIFTGTESRTAFQRTLTHLYGQVEYHWTRDARISAWQRQAHSRWQEQIPSFVYSHRNFDNIPNYMIERVDRHNIPRPLRCNNQGGHHAAMV